MAVRFRRLEELVGRVSFSAGGQFCPTLVIGLGGSGINTARRVKRIQNTRYGRLGILRFLFADCDQGEYAEMPDLAEVESPEIASVVATNATEVYEEVQQGLRPEIAAWLPEGVNVGILRHADGAGGIRPVGRFAFFCQFQNLYNRLSDACSQVMQIDTQVPTVLAHAADRIQVNTEDPRVYIVNSICGGTGSSIFLDVAILTRHLFHQFKLEPSIIGVFYLPSVFRNEPGITHSFHETILANGYAGLMELEHFCDPSIAEEQWKFDYPQIGSVSVDGPVFDECYLVEGINAQGQQLASKEEVFEMTARSICVDIGSPVGAHTRSAKRNTVTVIHTDPCHETGKFRLMNSIAVTGLKVPLEEMGRHCALRAGRAIINDRIIGSKPSADETRKQVNTFLRSNRLEERGEQDQIIERLLTDGEGNVFSFVLGRTRQELEQEADAQGRGGERGQAQYVASWIGSRLDEIRTQYVPRARTLVNENKLPILRTALDAVRQQMLQCAQQQGLAACQAFLEELSAVFQTVVNELTDEATDYEQSRSAAENDINEKRTFLNNYGSLMDRLFRGGDDEKAMDAALELTERHGNAEIKNVARAAALDLLNSQQLLDGTKALLPQINEWLQLVKDTRAVLEKTDKLIQGELDRRLPSAATASTYVLEQLVVQPSQFDSYYERASLNVAQLAQEVWAALTAEGQGDAAALEALRSYEPKPEALADLIASQTVDDLMRFFEQQASIIQAMQERKEAGESDAEMVKRQVQLMFNICQPFWTTRAPRGLPSYEPFMAVTVPCRSDDERLADIQQAVQDIVQKGGYKPELVHIDYPFALEICVRAYGARAYYLGSTADMKRLYETKMEQPNVRDLLHTDKRFIAHLPKLHPEPQEQAKLLFAWGIAYGYIAKRGEHFYVGVEERLHEGQRIPTPKYDSDWDAKITNLMDETWRGTPQQTPDSADLLAQGRVQAMERFIGSADAVRKLSEVPDRYVQRWGTQRVTDELTTYLSNLNSVIKKTRSEGLRPQYCTERELLEAYIQRLQGQA